MKQAAILAINFYQIFLSFDKGILSLLTPGGACKYDISCSEYTKLAITQHGVISGTWMGIKRIWRCR